MGPYIEALTENVVKIAEVVVGYWYRGFNSGNYEGPTSTASLRPVFPNAGAQGHAKDPRLEQVSKLCQ